MCVTGGLGCHRGSGIGCRGHGSLPQSSGIFCDLKDARDLACCGHMSWLEGQGLQRFLFPMSCWARRREAQTLWPGVHSGTGHGEGLGVHRGSHVDG